MTVVSPRTVIACAMNNSGTSCARAVFAFNGSLHPSPYPSNDFFFQNLSNPLLNPCSLSVLLTARGKELEAVLCAEPSSSLSLNLMLPVFAQCLTVPGLDE